MTTSRSSAPGSGSGNDWKLPLVVARMIALERSRFGAVIHSAPSGPVVNCSAPLPCGIVNSVIAPEVVMRPSLPADSVNHRASSGPFAMPCGMALGVGIWNSVNRPFGARRPTLPVLNSVNHTAPSGPAVIPSGELFGVGIRNSAIPPYKIHDCSTKSKQARRLAKP